MLFSKDVILSLHSSVCNPINKPLEFSQIKTICVLNRLDGSEVVGSVVVLYTVHLLTAANDLLPRMAIETRYDVFLLFISYEIFQIK